LIDVEKNKYFCKALSCFIAKIYKMILGGGHKINLIANNKDFGGFFMSSLVEICYGLSQIGVFGKQAYRN
jgi:hypothetical protein